MNNTNTNEVIDPSTSSTTNSIKGKETLYSMETTDLLNHRIKLMENLRLDKEQEKEKDNNNEKEVKKDIEDRGINKDKKRINGGGIVDDEPINEGYQLMNERYPTLSVKEYNKIFKRAQTVKSYLNTYYEYIEKYEEIRHPNESNKTTSIYEGVDGVWNPLQIMRNRRLRLHRGEKLKKEGDWRKVRITRRVFSKHEKSRLIWQVGLHEIIGDLEWREGKWNDLRGKDGKRIFKKDKGKDKDKNELRKVLKLSIGEQPIKKIHDKLFKDDDEEEEGKEGNENHHNEDDELDGNNDVNNGGNGYNNIEDDYFEKRGRNIHNSIEDNHNEEDSREVEEPIIPVVEIDNVDNVNNVDKDINIEEVVEILNIDSSISSSIALNELSMSLNAEKMLMQVNKWSTLFQDKMLRLDELEKISLTKCSTLQNIVNSCDNILETQKRDVGLQSAAVEELLGYCSRSSGAVNTGITLHLRQLHERADSLASGGNNNGGLLSKIVEITIVGALWMVWVVVEIWLGCKHLVVSIAKIIKWLIF
ncbi:hypothetical protein DAPK24_006620 [Pichia kluyveri]|uniref:Uncharacterized protein n=1 Tax=Pichia kluyveri TaxID=36015 RepID=A0AAV5QYM2_PICKL|nr:hypothetical protein DAPK24_006620 [Pichia kluyveri]